MTRLHHQGNRWGIDFDALEFDELPPQHQRTLDEVAVRLALGCNLDEIAAALGTTPKAVQEQLRKLRRELRQRFPDR